MKDQTDADLEQLMLELGRTRYRNRAAQASIKGRRTDVRSGRALLREAVGKLESALTEWRRRAKRRAGAGHSSAALLQGLPSPVVAFLVARTVLDGIALHQPLTALANAVGKAVEEEHRMRAVRRAARGRLEDAKGATQRTSLWPDLKRRLRRNARGGPYRKRRIVRGVAAQIGAALPDGFPRRERLRLGVTLVELLRIHTGLIEILTVPRAGKRPHAVAVATPAALNWLEQQDARNEVMSPFYLPMRTRPADWTDCWTGGYRLNAMLRRPVVKTRDRATVEAVERADPKLVYRAVSTVQRTPWRVNRAVFNVAKALWDSGAPIAGFRERLDEPPPPKLPPGAPPAAVEAAVRARADWRKRFHENRGRRVLAAKTMHLAGVHLKVPEFYFPHQADFRGRLYPQPFFLQPQGDDLARGLLEFAKGAPIRDRTAGEYFRAAGAGHFGINRVAQAVRIQWAHTHHDRILAAAADPLGYRWWLEAESPFQFLAWCLDFAAWAEAPARHVSHFRVPLDASCNGLQLYSLLTRDAVGAASTNVSPSDAPRDLYQDVADRATAKVLADPDPYAAQWLGYLGGSVPRRYVKRPTMVLPYGGTLHSSINYIRDALEEDRRHAPAPFDPLRGGGYRASTWLGKHVWAAILETVGRAVEAMDWLRAVSDLATEHGLPVKWTAPSGWPVVQRYTRYNSKRIQTAVGDSVRFIRYREDRDELSGTRQANGLPPNFIHSLDASVLAFAVCRARERGVESLAVIHDSFGVLAADAEAMRRTLGEVVADVFTTDVLKAFRDEVQAQMPAGVELPPLPEYGDLDVDGARRSMYLFN